MNKEGGQERDEWYSMMVIITKDIEKTIKFMEKVELFFNKVNDTKAIFLKENKKDMER